MPYGMRRQHTRYALRAGHSMPARITRAKVPVALGIILVWQRHTRVCSTPHRYRGAVASLERQTVSLLSRWRRDVTLLLRVNRGGVTCGGWRVNVSFRSFGSSTAVAANALRFLSASLAACFSRAAVFARTLLLRSPGRRRLRGLSVPAGYRPTPVYRRNDRRRLRRVSWRSMLLVTADGAALLLAGTWAVSGTLLQRARHTGSAPLAFKG